MDNAKKSETLLVIVLGVVGLVLTGGILSMINWRSRDFHLKSQRRNIRLVSVPSGTSAVASSKSTAAVNEA